MTDNELIEFATEFRDGILDGDPSTAMCFAVSAPLQSLLKMFGVETELIEFEVDTPKGLTNHFCLQLSDGRILDATADQFGHPAAYLGNRLSEYGEVKENAS